MVVPVTPFLQVLSELAGTLEYMAPEVLQRNYCQQADIWSTGVVLYELIAGRTPYSGDTVEQVKATQTPSLCYTLVKDGSLAGVVHP